MNCKSVYFQPNKIILFAFIILAFSCKKEVKTVHKVSKKDTVSTVEPEEEKVIPTEIESNFLKRLINEEIGEQKYKEMQISESPYYVSFANVGDPYTVSFSIFEKGDFNNDRIIDYVIHRSSEGMLGGNANTNDDFIFYIMKDEIHEKESHSILGYAPFSYNIIDKANFVDNKFKIKVTQNFRTYLGEDLKSASFSFIYKNGNLYEESYLSSCKLARLKSKTIFNDIPAVEKRTRSIEMHNYTETIEEIYKKNDTIITASAGGCDNLELSFTTFYKVEPDRINDSEYKKETALQLLEFLSENTQFSNEINVAVNYYQNNAVENKYIKKIKGYEFGVVVDKDDDRKGELRFLFQIKKIDNPYQTENWEIATRNKKPIKVDDEY
ncbi:hypothetical protein [Flavobacterium sp. ov086]|uniref:hypothetical protein n=1 Tax=Flavobacterium sp. ov086 TaxID=1761785 RepID=UPI000B6ACA02|nr:hypothetical protein [Flavobacterium sp. ov086]SNR91939.1 hypothetical protein SAMN04487979_13052 [Flavobacterium sp. ov086]